MVAPQDVQTYGTSHTELPGAVEVSISATLMNQAATDDVEGKQARAEISKLFKAAYARKYEFMLERWLPWEGFAFR